MGRTFEHTLHRRRYTNDHYKKMPNITTLLGIANYNHNEIHTNVKWYSHFGKHQQFNIELKHTLTIQPTNPTLGYLPKRNANMSTKSCM